MQDEKQLNEHESLRLIQQMISMAKKEQVDDGRGWIVWGWLLFLASVFTIVNLHTRWFADMFFFWNIFGVLTVVVFGFEFFSKFVLRKNSERVKTYTGDLFSRLNAGFFICLVLIIVAINIGSRVLGKNSDPSDDLLFVNIGFALLTNLYAFWILIYGTALNFRPSIIGAYVAWACAIAALFSLNFEVVMIMQSMAVLSGYIIPGHMANLEFKKVRKMNKVAERV